MDNERDVAVARDDASARRVDFGYHNGPSANMEMITRRTLQVRFIAPSSMFPFLTNDYRREYVLVPTPQEIRMFRDVLGSRSVVISVYCARVYRALRYVPAGSDTRVEVVTE